MRAVGHRHKVVIIQFMKWWTETGEYLIKDRLKPYYQIYQFGRPGWIRFSEGDKEIRLGGTSLLLRNIEDSDRELARKALEFSEKTCLKINLFS